MKRWVRVCCALLVLCLLLSAVPGMALADSGAEEAVTTDFVLVMDCSGTMTQNDPQGLCADACKMFIDLIPVQDARVSVIAFGYEGDDAFVYTSRFQVNYDANLVHVIVPMDDVTDTDAKEEYKDKIDEVGEEFGERTPVGQALAAAVDVLLTSGAADKNACVVLMSDGELTSGLISESQNLVDEAASEAKRHKWPIYCIELDYHDRNEEAGSQARALLNKICEESGAGADGRMKVDSPADVCEAFLKIFNNFMIGGSGNIEPVVIDKNGMAERTFEIPNLASEANIVVSGSAVNRVELVNVSEDSTIEITGSIDSKNLQAAVEPGSYYCLKLICPTAGTWKVRAYGDADASILVYDSSLQELALTMVTDPPGGTRVLNKNEKIEVDAYFSYYDQVVYQNSFYTEKAATLLVYSENGSYTSFTMDADENGYHYALPVSAVPSGVFELQVVLEHNMFRNGEKRSNISDPFTSENIELKLASDANSDRSEYLNREFERIDLNDIFANPDGDPVTYDVYCVSDRNVKFDYKIDESGYLYIPTGVIPGVYEMEVTAIDPDMKQPLVHAFKLEVLDRAIVAGEPEPVELWTDAYPFQESGATEHQLNLADYFTDPDGMPLTYTVSGADAAVANVTLSGTTVTIVPVAEGETTVTFTANDTVSDKSVQMTVTAVSGKGIFWAKNWIWFALAGVILLIIVITILIVQGNRGMKGLWTISLTNADGDVSEFERANIVSVTKVGKKKKFLLKDLINEMSNFMSNAPAVQCSDYFMCGNGAEKIELHGVTSKRGVEIRKIPTDDRVKVLCNGLEKHKKAKITSGSVVFILRMEQGGIDTMTIKMELVS